MDTMAGGEKFGLRWQSAAATPLWDFERAAKAAWRFASRRTPKFLRFPAFEFFPLSAGF
jgi:hypothetical protein